MFNSKKSDTVTMFFNDHYKKNQSHSYSKTINNTFQIKSKSFNMLFPKPKGKNLCIINRNKDNISIALGNLGFTEGDYNSYDNLNKGREEFLMYEDKEKYTKYLKKEYHFFNTIDINQNKFLFERNKRIKLFKSIQNDKFFEKQKKVTFKEKLINKIIREKYSNNSILPKFLISKKLKIKESPKKFSNNKKKFNEKCKKIYLNIKKNFP